jgi:elongation factor P--beta-lysine ligase
MGDVLALTMALASNLGTKITSKSMPMETRFSNFVKGKALMVQDREGYILYPENYPEYKIRRIHAKKSHPITHHAYIYRNEASSSRHTTHVKMPKKKLLIHQMNLVFHLRPLIHPLFSLTNQAK